VPELTFQVEKGEPLPFAALPQLVFQVRIACASAEPIHTIALRCQVRIEPARRRYQSDEADRLRELPVAVWKEMLDHYRVVDFGIRGFDLACALLDGYDAAILVDALQRGRSPGTLCVIEPALDDSAGADVPMSAHGLHPAQVLRLVRTMGGPPPRCLRLVGCEEEPALGLSEPVAAVIDDDVKLIEEMVSEMIEAER
jgi:hydrogenase maturation protease